MVSKYRQYVYSTRVTDRQTDRRTDRITITRPIVASRGKTKKASRGLSAMAELLVVIAIAVIKCVGMFTSKTVLFSSAAITYDLGQIYD